MSRKPVMTFVECGDVERWARVHGALTTVWRRGYAQADEAARGGPWRTKTECRAEARAAGCVAKFEEEK